MAVFAYVRLKNNEIPSPSDFPGGFYSEGTDLASLGKTTVRCTIQRSSVDRKRIARPEKLSELLPCSGTEKTAARAMISQMPFLQFAH
jgi:hypothetical protein